MLVPIANAPVKFRATGERFFEEIAECYLHNIPYANKSQCDDTVAFQVGIENDLYEDSQVGWAIKDNLTGEYVFVETDGSHVEYNEAGTIAKVEFIWNDLFPCETTVFNEPFDNNDAGWSLTPGGGVSEITGGVLHFTSSGAGNLTISPAILENSKTYRITIVVTAISSSDGTELKLLITDDSANLLDENISAVGTYEFELNTTTIVGDNYISLNGDGGLSAFDVSISSILIEEISCENSCIHGCYKICVFDIGTDDNFEQVGDEFIYLQSDNLNTNPDFDFTDVIVGGNFSNPSDWSTDANWNVAAGIASHTAGVADSIYHNAAITIDDITSFQLEYDQLGTTAGATQVYFGGTLSTPEGGNLTHEENLLTGFDGSFQVNANSAFDGDIDNVKLYAINNVYDASGGGVLFDVGTSALLSGNADLELVILEVGKKYLIRFTFTRTAGTLTLTANGGTVNTYAASGTYEELVDITSSDELHFTGGVTMDGILTAIEIYEYITVEEALNEGVITSSDQFCSEPFNVKTTHPCTKIIRWRNDENAFGFEYVNFLTYYHYFRMNCKLGRPTYPVEQSNHEDSSAHNRILRAQVDKTLEMWTEHLPEYVHDAISMGIKHDDFEILDEDRSASYVAYVSDPEDYEPNWEDDELPLARVRTTMKLKTPSTAGENPNC